MAVTIKVNGRNLSLAHKGTNGFVKNTLPDVCKTPSPGGPVPIPYPVIVSFSRDLRNGTKTVKADRGNMIAIKGSEFSRCIGDEPGTAGGVKSQTNMKEAKWILYAFDVKMDGKNACRLTDRMTMNHGNTVSLGGYTAAPVTVEDLQRVLCKFIKECELEENQNAIKDGGNPNSHDWCGEDILVRGKKTQRRLDLGDKKAECAEKKINEAKKAAKDAADAAGDPGLEGIWSEVHAEQYIRVPGGGWIKPDVIVGDPPSCEAVFDFKTSCPPRNAENDPWPIYSSDPGPGQRRAPNSNYDGWRQDEIYADVCGKTPKKLHPQGKQNCP